MNAIALFVGLLAAGYLVGSIPFGALAGLLKGVDIQRQGSGNIGFANVLRQLGWQWAVPVLVGDLLKGYLPVVFALKFLTLNQAALVGLVTLIGSILSPWLSWRGGKGVATLLGVSVALSPHLGSIGIGLWVFIAMLTQTTSIASLVAASTLFLISFFLAPTLIWLYGISLIIIGLTHKTNIQRLLNGTEKTVNNPRSQKR